ncbi:MAG: hypothetical protein HY321_04020 [Armatimonadetes bacterium]|nr:hypothetical protein [Armatimonadota bacterium]
MLLHLIGRIGLVLGVWAFFTGAAPLAALAENAPPPPPPEAAPETPTGSERGVPAGGRFLQLPDISFIGSAIGKLSSDSRDEDRDRVLLDEAEVGIQSYVYPNIRADAFLVASGHEGFKLELEEGYLTHEQLPLRFSGRLGKFFVPFGRTNQLHPHSWPYARRPLAWRNLVAAEALTGNGVAFSWLAPTRGPIFLRLDAGAYTQAGHSHGDEEEEQGHGDILAGPGASFADKFYTARAWSGLGLGRAGELEAGGSRAGGPASPVVLSETPEVLGSRKLRVTGVDLSYRRYGSEARRLLLRAEHLWHRYDSDLGRETTRGYYAFANYRWDKYNDFGLLYDWSGIPEAGGHHESAGSVIYTRQLNERTYARLQWTHGNRPGARGYDEGWLQIVWGLGPHTHQLE